MDRIHREGHIRIKGFALIATLSLMVLLVLLSLAIMTLSTLELRTSQSENAEDEARANARLALMLAIGELQKNLGPDQRVNANASIHHASQTKRSQWMGVYRSWPGDTSHRPAPQFLRWLVSGDPDALSSEQAHESSVPVAGEMVTLVGEGSVGNGRPDFHVEAGRIAVGARHGMAWWVGDETSKARIPGSIRGAEAVVGARGRLMASPRTGIERVSHLQLAGLDDARLEKVASLACLDFLSGPSDTGAALHDLTPYSAITMTNVRKGGLKRDLSMFMARPAPPASDPEPLYEIAGQPGITMLELWRYCNLWNQLVYPDLPVSHPDGGVVPAKTPMLITDMPHQQAVNDPYFTYRRLTLLRTSWIVSHMARKETNPATGNDHYQLYIVLDPVLTIWNPFDVAIKLGRNSYQGFKFWGIPYITDISVNGVKSSYRLNSLVGSNFFLRLHYGLQDDIVLRPGEVLVVSQGERDTTVTTRVGSTVQLKLGWEFGAGFRFKAGSIAGPSTTRLTHAYRPNPSGHFGVGLTEFLHYHGRGVSAYAADSVWVGGLIINRKLGGNTFPKLQATDAPHLFPNIEEQSGASYTLGEIQDRKRPTMIYSLDMKMETDPLNEDHFQGRFKLRHNPKLPGYDLQSFDALTIATTPMQISVKGLNSWKDAIVNITRGGQGYAGGSYAAGKGNSYMVTHSIPREPVHSIAALQHALGNGTLREGYLGRDDPLAPTGILGDSRSEPTRNYFLQPSISHAVGNAFAPSFLGSSEIEGELNRCPAADHSYLVNQALWDDWFFSSIAPQTSESWKISASGERSQRKVCEDFLGLSGAAGSVPLPISCFRPWVRDGKDALAELFNGDVPATEADRMSAAFLLLEGGFNVNSTSEMAWKLLLSGLRGASIGCSDPRASAEVSLLQPGPDKTVLAGLLTPFGNAIDDRSLNDPGSKEQWKGYRALSDDQIDQLAAALVRQVRARGPFLSLADFVNRRLSDDVDLSISGALQSALDDEQVTINESFNTGARAVDQADAAAAGLKNPEAEAGAAAAGIPGYVKQADILTSIGAYLTPRSDTYRIRAYGEARSADGARVLARAWCEAVVQRVPDYLDAVDPAMTEYAALASRLNQSFGRRMLIVGFRWLNANEI